MLIPTFKQIRSAGVSLFSKMDEEILREAFGGGPTLSGTSVSKNTALEIPTLFSCAALFAKLEGQLKPSVFIERKSGGKDKVSIDDSELGSLQFAIHKQPNSEMSDFTRRETQSFHETLWAKGVDLIQRDNAGRIVELWPLLPWRVEKIRVDNQTTINAWDVGSFGIGEIAYEISFTDGRPNQKVSPDRIMYIPSQSLNGLVGLSVVDLQRELLGITKAIAEYEARFFGQGFMPSLKGEVDGYMDTPQAAAYVARLKEAFAGLGQSHGMVIAENGMKITPIDVRLDHAMLDERAYNNSVAICGALGIPPPLVGLTREATFSNITEQNLFFGQYGLAPRLARKESAMFMSLLSDRQKRNGTVIKYNLNAILRADIVKRWNAYAQAIDRGVMNADQVLDLEDMNPQPDGMGQMYLVPRNFRDKSKPDDTTPVQAARAQEAYERTRKELAEATALQAARAQEEFERAEKERKEKESTTPA